MFSDRFSEPLPAHRPFKHVAEHLNLRPQIVVAEPFNEVADGFRPALVVQNPQHGSLLPCREDAAVGEFPERIIISKVGQACHFLCQLIGYLVEWLHHKTALAVVQPQQVAIELFEEIFVVRSLSRNLSASLATGFVGERYASEETIGQVFLVKSRAASGVEVKVRFTRSRGLPVTPSAVARKAPAL